MVEESRQTYVSLEHGVQTSGVARRSLPRPGGSGSDRAVQIMNVAPPKGGFG